MTERIGRARSGRSSRNSSQERLDNPKLKALMEALDRFSDAYAIVETACIAMEAGDDYPPELSALRSGVRMLDAVYDEFDGAINAID